MKITLQIRHKQGWWPNTDFAVREISKRRIKMPGGFEFTIPDLTTHQYPGKHQSCFTHPTSPLTFEFTIPIGYIRTPNGETPNFREQKTNFETHLSHRNFQKIEEQTYRLSITTTPETQLL